MKLDTVPDVFQQAWQAHSCQTRVKVDANLLLRAVQRNRQELRAVFSMGYLGGIAELLLGPPVWIYMGVTIGLPWTWYLMVPVIVCDAAFNLLVRPRIRSTPNDPSDPLLSSVQESLALVEQQIWQQRNIVWRSLLPSAVAMLVFIGHVSWLKSGDWLGAVSDVNTFVIVIILVIFCFTYYTTRRVVRTQYEPRRRELLALLASLRDETTSDVSGEYPILMSGKGIKSCCSPRRMLVAGLCAVALLLVGLAGIFIANLFDQVSHTGGTARSAVPIEDAEQFRARIDEFLHAARTKAGFSGAIIVARGGEPIYERALGLSHLESKAPNTLDTPFRIASLSKQFTAAAIFRLEAQGKLNIDDPVHQYLPEFAESPYREITIHHLLTHTSGLPRTPTGIMGAIRWNNMSRAATPVDDYVTLAVGTPLEFEPGTKYEYSNIGYRVLAALIARVTGRQYADFMEQEIFQPLGMNDSGVARVTRPPSEARIAEGLTFRSLDSAGEPLFANGEGGRNFGTGYGSGGIYTSAIDLVRWDRVLAGDEFLSETQKKRLFQPIHENYACGWIVKKSGLDGRLYHMHNGANEGFYSQMMRLPGDDLVIIAVGNVDSTPAIDDVLEQLFLLCRSLPYQEP
jgi:CubicO group peptidase (beta-lactamase class C family)